MVMVRVVEAAVSFGPDGTSAAVLLLLLLLLLLVVVVVVIVEINSWARMTADEALIENESRFGQEQLRCWINPSEISQARPPGRSRDSSRGHCSIMEERASSVRAEGEGSRDK